MHKAKINDKTKPKLTKKKLAKMLGMSRGTLYKKISGELKFTPKEELLLKHFGVI